ncbi:MAG: putative oxidoreductase [Verrucomicrobiaceae bacterium]|nr:putative oxidoreductase [Verrucomicrobiaceae bacterium]
MKKPSIIITGAASGIGKATAELLHQAGARLTLMDTDAKGLEKLGRRLKDVILFPGDVANEEDVRSVIEKASHEHGGIDGIVCNAGIMKRIPVEKLSLEDWQRVLAVNLTQSFLFAKHGAKALRKSKAGGAMVLMASTRAFMSEPHTESYTATKGGLFALAHGLAMSLGPAIRVNAIAPGWINVTDEKLRRKDHSQHPVGRVGTPGDIAETVRFLLDSKTSGFITGQTFIVDGGMSVKMIYEP